MYKSNKNQHIFERDFDVQQTLDLLNLTTFVFWSWGPEEITRVITKGYSNGKLVDQTDRPRGLAFTVNGRKFQGWVVITLDWLDVYAVHFLNEDFELLDSCRDVYVDVLVETIDDRVES
jgi:hypothetical protein